MSAITVSPWGLSIIMAFEGFYPKPYVCPAGVLTQGYGHTAAAGGEALGGVWTKEKARAVLEEDIARNYLPGVLKLLRRPATQGQLDAMVSFAFNCGVPAFKRSSILKFFNRGEAAQAAASFALWVKAGGKTMPGLVRRRGSEALAFQGIKDIDFDGRRDKDEPVYGTMPQKVDQARESIASSKAAIGSATATAGGVAIAATQIKDITDTVKAANEHLAGTSLAPWVGMAIAALIIVGGAVALYARWKDAGRPIPAFLRGG